jgi:hypothetical protein
MAWLPISGDLNLLWEYSNDPNADKKANDSYDYDLNAGHVAGIRVNAFGPNTYVLCRQIAKVWIPPVVEPPADGYWKTVVSAPVGYGEQNVQ